MIKRVAALAVVAVGLTASPASAGVKNFDFYCTSGGFMVCASVHVSTFKVGTQWKLRMEVWNLAGVAGQQYNLSALGITKSGFSGTYNLASVTQGSNNITSAWKVPGNAVSGGGVTVEASTQTTQGSNGIIGCGPSPAGGGTKWQTCVTNGDPAVVFTFNTSAEILLANAEIRFHATQLPNGASVKCDTGIPGGDGGSFLPCTVVPEPITMVLLGTGLAGLGGVGALRRRRRGVDVENG